MTNWLAIVDIWPIFFTAWYNLSKRGILHVCRTNLLIFTAGRKWVSRVSSFPVVDWFCLLIYEFWLSLWKIARCSILLLLPLLTPPLHVKDSSFLFLLRTGPLVARWKEKNWHPKISILSSYSCGFHLHAHPNATFFSTTYSLRPNFVTNKTEILFKWR